MKKIDNPKKQADIALKKAQSHLKKIRAMLENDAYCIDIITQILAVNGLLRSASDKMFKQHLRTCFINGMKGENHCRQEEMIGEVLEIIKLTAKN